MHAFGAAKPFRTRQSRQAKPSVDRPPAIPPLIVLLLAACLGACQSPSPPYSPEQALETFQIEQGFRIELFAAEPVIRDPVAMEFDEFGRIYVVETPGYPLDTETAGGTVKLLVDTDSDGLPDSVTVFADGLTMPTGIMRWKQGVIVTDPPSVLYFEDTIVLRPPKRPAAHSPEWSRTARSRS